MRALIAEAEDLAAETCERCGQSGTWRGNLDWISVLCDTHYAQARRRR